MKDSPGCSQPVKVIFFDLGGVLVDVHFERFVAALALAASISPEAMRIRLEPLRPESQQFDRGEIDSTEFHHRIARHLGLDLDLPRFKSIYSDIFSLKDDIAELALALKESVRISIISNTDPLHYGYIMEQYPVLQIFEKPVTSFDVGALKPDPDIYRFALTALQVDAPNAIFIDDQPQNVAGARSLGMQALHFINGESLRRQLELCFPQIAVAGIDSQPDMLRVSQQFDHLKKY